MGAGNTAAGARGGGVRKKQLCNRQGHAHRSERYRAISSAQGASAATSPSA